MHVTEDSMPLGMGPAAACPRIGQTDDLFSTCNYPNQRLSIGRDLVRGHLYACLWLARWVGLPNITTILC